MSRFVIVSGIPASGKSTVGRALATALTLPFIDKDTVLESLFEHNTPTDAKGRNDLSRLADESFRAQALSGKGAVLASWWKHPRTLSDSGTPSQWLTSLPGTLVELHCVCAPNIAADRFLARKRHTGHLDGQRSHAELLAQFNQHAPLGPLGVGSLIEVRTSEPVDINALVRQVTHVFASSLHVQPTA